MATSFFCSLIGPMKSVFEHGWKKSTGMSDDLILNFGKTPEASNKW